MNENYLLKSVKKMKMTSKNKCEKSPSCWMNKMNVVGKPGEEEKKEPNPKAPNIPEKEIFSFFNSVSTWLRFISDSLYSPFLAR